MSPRNVLRGVLLCALVFVAARASFRGQSPQDEPQRRSQAADNLRGVLLHQVLRPPIRGGSFYLRFSPDGKFLLVQGVSGFIVFSTSPLRPFFYLDADYLHEARFAGDSKAVTIVSFALRTGRWRLPEATGGFRGELAIPGGCLAGEVSPNGETFACYRADLSLHVYDVASGEEVLSDKLQRGFLGAVLAPISFFSDNLLARPIGYTATKSYDMYANRGMALETISFSPDSESLLLGTLDGSFSWSLSSKRKTDLPGAFKKPRDGGLCYLDAERVLSFSRSDSPEIFSLKTGKAVAKLPLEAAFVRLASDPRYLTVSSETKSGKLFDLDSNNSLEVPENIALDVRDNTLALITPEANLALFRLGESVPIASSPIPLESTPSRLFVAASPDLDLLSLGFGQQSALFRVSTGERLADIDNSSETAVPDIASTYFVSLARGKLGRDVMRLDPANGAIHRQWRSEGLLSRASSAALYEYAFSYTSPIKKVPALTPEGSFWFELSAHEWSSGRTLWSKQFSAVHPVPFPDAQGKRLVLGWDAKGNGGESAARRCPQAWPLFRKAKLNPKDTFFEVLDGATGLTVGGVLVQTGAGPFSFDSVFSAGPMLITSKDEGRSVLYSLEDGQAKAHLNGFLPAASAEARLFALIENGDHLVLYDLTSGSKLGQQKFPEAIAYTHFSADGRRILVVTRKQSVYVLDVSEIRTRNSPAQ